MKFLDLHAQYKSIQKEIDKAIADVIHSTSFILGKQVEDLENQIADYIGVKYAVGLNSGSDALTASLIALGIGKGDEVIIPAFTYIATAETVSIAGANVVFVDIDAETYNINPEKLTTAITQNTKAIIPVHLYGKPAAMSQIMSIAKQYDLLVIEDLAQAIGAEYNGQKVGSFGDISCLSFFPTKNLGAYGDGGMLVTNKKEVVDFIRQWRIHGQSKKYYSNFIGVSSRLDTLQAAILLAKLPHLDSWIEVRRNLAQIYSDQLADIPIQVPTSSSNEKHVFHQYTIRIPNKRDEVRQILKKKDIPTMVYYPDPLHTQKAYSKFTKTNDSFIESEKASNEVLSLPIYPELASSDQKMVIDSITQILT